MTLFEKFGYSAFIPYICIMRRKKGKSIVKKKKVKYDGTDFDSYLEAYMYKILKANDISFKYNTISYTLVDGFLFQNNSYERQVNGKGEFKDRGNAKIRPITYKPDFIVGNEDFIIETKGWSNDTFPMRWKLFKKMIFDENKNSIILKPQTKKECDESLNLILEFYDR